MSEEAQVRRYMKYHHILYGERGGMRGGGHRRGSRSRRDPTSLDLGGMDDEDDMDEEEVCWAMMAGQGNGSGSGGMRGGRGGSGMGNRGGGGLTC